MISPPPPKNKIGIVWSQRDAEFLGAVIGFPDGSMWALFKAQSAASYDYSSAPYKGHRVFVARCVKDKESRHLVQRLAVVKVKFQCAPSPLYSVTTNQLYD
jgi:hypothetical protein